MLVFGPYRSIPQNENFIVYNLSSPTMHVPKLPGLYVYPEGVFMMNNGRFEENEQAEVEFDMWYYNYVLNDPVACSSLMQILNSLYNEGKVYVCIDDSVMNPGIGVLNESFMKILQARYDIKYSVINEPSDIDYIPRDGCDFASARGIETFDSDKMQFMIACEAQKIRN